MPVAAGQLVILENRAQVRWAGQMLPAGAGTRLVALTAEALQALEEYELPHDAICTYADTRRLASVDEQINIDSFVLAQEIETYVAHRYEGARFDGPSFLSSQGYSIQYSASAILTRAFLMREAIRACSPRLVTMFSGEVDPWFSGDGYADNPWLCVIEAFAADQGISREIVSRVVPSPPQRSAPDPVRFLGRAYRYANRKVHECASALSRNPLALAHREGLRLLMADSTGYDWAPVLERLRSLRSAECFSIQGKSLDTRFWTYYYDSSVSRLWERRARRALDVAPLRFDEAETELLSGLFDEWMRERPEPPRLEVLGMDLFPALAPHLRAMTLLGPGLAHHADAVACEVLKATEPDVVCFFAIPRLSSKRLAFQCRRRGIPVVCYQHGGAYGTQPLLKNEQIETAHADYFLTYGEGVKPLGHSIFRSRAQCVPVGSSRVAAMAPKGPGRPMRTGHRVRVLWIGEISTRNVIGGTFQVEDTRRYLLQRQCLQTLSNSNNLRVTYRPYPHQIGWDGTSRWLTHVNSRLRLDEWRPLGELLAASDVVITDSSSSTVWNEVLALKRPLILYCAPDQTPLLPRFVAELEQACYWCKSQEAMVRAIARLACEGRAFVAELGQIDATAFIRTYVLHREDGLCCVDRVLSFLGEIGRNGRIPASQTGAAV